MINIIRQEAYTLADVALTEANLSNAEAFKTKLLSVFNEQQKGIILNMEQVTYIDSTFLGALVAGLKHAISLKQDLILVGLQADIFDLFKLIRLDKVFKIYSNYNDAISKLN
jgi:anti-sigma B factor antagonist